MRRNILAPLVKFLLLALLAITTTFNAIYIIYESTSPLEREGKEDLYLFGSGKQVQENGLFHFKQEKVDAGLRDDSIMRKNIAESEDASWLTPSYHPKVNAKIQPDWQSRSTKSGIMNPEDEKWVTIEAQSDKKHVYVSINGHMIYEDKNEGEIGRGLHVIVLNQHTANVTALRIFDAYDYVQDEEIASFLDSLQEGRIVVFAIKDEATFNLKTIGKNAIKAFGSQLIDKLEFRNSWAFIGKKNSPWAVEDMEKPSEWDEWPLPVKVRVSFMLLPKLEGCNYGENDEARRRREFCEAHDGYGNLCKCNDFDRVDIKAEPLVNNTISSIPIAIIASNRPNYLYRMLRKLLRAQGADPRMMTVYIDDLHAEATAVAKLFKIRVIHNKIGCSKNCRVQQHYKKSLTQTFDQYPEASAMIILEEDLEVSIDIFDYFSQTLPLLEKDPSLYCISAWNDQGYKHAVKDPAMLYRVETMPGLGW